MRNLFEGKELNTRTMTSLNLNFRSLMNFKGLVIKFVNGNMILPWVARRFECSKILMLRHPCAVVNSQLIFGGWNSLTKENLTIPDGLFEDFPILKEVYDRVEEHEEILAFNWLCEAYVPLQDPEQNWLTLFYEDLVQNKESEIKKVFTFLNKEIPASAFERIHKPSATTKKNSNVAQKKNPLEGWREKLTQQQIERILNVLKMANFNIYTEELEPNRNWRAN